MRGRAEVSSVHAGMMRPFELEALDAQKRSHRSGSVLQTAARPSPPTPQPPLPFEYKGERGSKMK